MIDLFFAYMAKGNEHALTSMESLASSFLSWLFDSGASSHFTPYLKDLVDVSKLVTPINVRVADGSLLKATHIGSLIINFVSTDGTPCTLKLLRVLYVPGLARRLFSIVSFISAHSYEVIYKRGKIVLDFGHGVKYESILPRSGSEMNAAETAFNGLIACYADIIYEDRTQFEALCGECAHHLLIENVSAHDTVEVEPPRNDQNNIDDPQSVGGVTVPIWEQPINNWNDIDCSVGKRKIEFNRSIRSCVK